MRLRSRQILAIGAGVLMLGGCAAAAGPAGPTTSPTGRVYEPGTAPTQTRQSQTATLFVAQGAFDQALAAAQEGIAADSANPVHYYLAGQAYAGLRDYAAADRMFERAEEIYPAYEIEVEPEREQAWGIAFNEGVEAYNAGDLEAAAEAWARANQIYDVRPEAFMNLAIVRAQAEDYDAAIEAYQGGLAALDRVPATRELEAEEIAEREETRSTMRTGLAELLMFRERFSEAETLFRQALESDPDNPELLSQLAVTLARQGQEDEAAAIYTRLLAQPDLTTADLFNVGVSLFNARAYEQAAEAFRRVTQAHPNSRDAWYNLANSLYALDRFADLVPVSERLVELDPLNENSALIMARALRETGQNQRALAELQRNAALPVHIEQIEMRPREDATRVTGTIVGNQAPAGTPVRLRFNFYGDSGQLGSETINVAAPATDEQTRFEAVFSGPEMVTHYNYELLD